jgi:hypothetical protein
MSKQNIILSEGKVNEPHTKEAPIVLQSINCKALFNNTNKTITIEVPNGDTFVSSASAFKWVEGYPKSIGLSHKRCETALNHLMNDNFIDAYKEIYKLPYAPFFVYLFETDRPMLKNLSYITDKTNETNKEKVEIFIKTMIEEKEESTNLKKSDPETYNFIKKTLENQILYLKAKCEVFYWFYQGLPQLSQFGIW